MLRDRIEGPLVKDTLYTFLFGVLFAVLGKVQFHIPNVGNSDLGEIALLIGLFHLRNPIFIVGLCLPMLFGGVSEIPRWIVFSAHVVPLFIAYAAFKFLERKNLPNLVLGLSWMAVTLIYYLLLLLPLVTLTLLAFSTNERDSFLDTYVTVASSVRFEMITTTLVSGFYLMRFEIQKKLEHNNRNLEKIVEQRTIELTSANNELQSLNEELKSSNDSVKGLNENLEQLVRERTNKINEQLNQLRKYAHMNSHELRAPLARMLGLLEVIRLEKDPEQLKDLLRHLLDSSEELDKVIKEMNRLLEKEIVI